MSKLLAQKDKFKSKQWRLNNLYKIVDKKARLIKFQELPFQNEIRTDKRRIKQVLKYRQGGVTTGCVLDMFDDVIWRKNMTAVIIAHKRQDLPKIFEKVRVAHRNMHPHIRPQVDKGGGSRYEMRFPKVNSKIYIDIENRGDTIHRLHVSEAAFVEPARLKATLGAVVPDGQITYESTPNGMGNDFYKQWINPKSSRSKLFFPWFIQSEYQLDPSHMTALTVEEQEFCERIKRMYGVNIHWGQIAWRRVQMEEYKEEFWQEFPEDDRSCFLASGGCPVDQELVSKLITELQDPYSDDGTLRIYKPYETDHRYVIAADVAQGVKADYSVADVYDVQTMEQVAQFRSNTLKPYAFGEKLCKIAELYWKGGRPWPLIAVELNNHGHAVNGYLENTANYSNIYRYKEDTCGWLTNSVTRPKMIDVFIEALETGTITVNSPYTLGECLSLVDNDGKIEATEGEHDDTIIAGSIGVQMLIHEGTNSVYDDLHSKILM